MRFVSVLRCSLLLLWTKAFSTESIYHDVASQNANLNIVETSYATAVHQASPECWKNALKAFQYLRHETQNQQSTLDSTAAAAGSPSELSASLCSAMTSQHQDLLALEVTRCHMKGRSIFLSSSESCSSSSSRDNSSLEGCIQQLTDTAFTTFTQFKIYIYQICSRVTAEMVLQRQQDMVQTLTELASTVQDRQDHLQSYWEQAWEKGQGLDEQRHTRHQTWLAEQDVVQQRQQTIMASMMGLAHRMESRQGDMQQFWDNVWERARQRQEQWEQQSTTWLEQQQSLQQDQVQHLERFRQEMNQQQNRHATLVEQHSQQMQFLVDRHRIDLEKTQQRHDEMEQKRQATWLLQQQALQQDQRQDLERNRDELQAWQADQAQQIERHAQHIQLLTERHYQELQQWQQQQALQAQKHEQELQAFANGIAASAKPLLATETFVRRLFVGLTWWTSLLYLMVILNLVWLLTLPRRCRSIRGSLLAVTIAEAMLEIVLHRLDCSSLVNNAWTWMLQPSCHSLMEYRGEMIGWLRKSTVVLECMVYLIGFITSFLGSNSSRKVDSTMDVRLQQIEERHLELLQRLEQRSSMIADLLLQPNESFLPPPASGFEIAKRHYPQSHSFLPENGHRHHQYERVGGGRHPEKLHFVPPVVSPPNQSSPNPSRHDGVSLLAPPTMMAVVGQPDKKMVHIGYDDDDDEENYDEEEEDYYDNNDDNDQRQHLHDLSSQAEWQQRPFAQVNPTFPQSFDWASDEEKVASTRVSKRPQDDSFNAASDMEQEDFSCSPPPKKIPRIA